MFTRIVVGDNERVLIARNKRFAEILGPGEYNVFGLGVTQERFNVRDLVFASEWADFIVKERQDVAAEYFTVIETSDPICLAAHNARPSGGLCAHRWR